MAGVRCLVHTELAVLTKESYDEVLKLFPQWGQSIVEKAKNVLQEHQKNVDNETAKTPKEAVQQDQQVQQGILPKATEEGVAGNGFDQDSASRATEQVPSLVREFSVESLKNKSLKRTKLKFTDSNSSVASFLGVTPVVHDRAVISEDDLAARGKCELTCWLTCYYPFVPSLLSLLSLLSVVPVCLVSAPSV